MGSDFFVPTRSFSVSEIVQLTGASLVDESTGALIINSLASASEAASGSLAFVDGKKNAHLMAGLAASAVLCPDTLKDAVPAGVAALIHRNPALAFARVAREMFPEAAFPVGATGTAGISPQASIHPSASLEDGVTVEAGAVIGADVAVGSGSVISSNAVLGPHVRVGRNSFVGPNASVRYALIGDRVIVHAGASIGRDGFGFALGERGLEHVPQLGRVVLQDDVEIGANSAVDRGALGDTIIGEGTKIDNLVQIGHNTKIGRHCVVAGQCGIAGSVTIGDFAMIGGGVGIADHVKIGVRAQIAGGSGIMENIPDGERWAGYPAVPFRQFFRQFAFLRDVANEKKGKPDG